MGDGVRSTTVLFDEQVDSRMCTGIARIASGAAPAAGGSVPPTVIGGARPPGNGPLGVDGARATPARASIRTISAGVGCAAPASGVPSGGAGAPGGECGARWASSAGSSGTGRSLAKRTLEGDGPPPRRVPASPSRVLTEWREARDEGRERGRLLMTSGACVVLLVTSTWSELREPRERRLARCQLSSSSDESCCWAPPGTGVREEERSSLPVPGERLDAPLSTGVRRAVVESPGPLRYTQ